MKENSLIEAFEQFMEMIELSEKHDLWVKQHSTESYVNEILKEIEELKAGITNNYLDNIKEEMADVLYDIFVLAKIGEREYNFTIEQLMQQTMQKMKRRKPYIFEGKTVTAEESDRIWQEVKQKEKQNRINN